MKMGKGNFVAPYQAHLKIDSIFKGLPAEAAGMKEGDKLLSVNGNRVFSVETCKKVINENKGSSVSVQIARGNDTLTIMPVVNDSGLIGVRFKPEYGNYPETDYTFGSALFFGASDATEAIVSNIKGLRQIFRGKEKASENLQGPIGIATIYGPVLEWSRFWTITGLLSMILAFMNILPIPALDGGHVVFLLIEAITRKRFSDKFMERAQVAGMIILLSLMVFSVGNDIWKHWIN
jgi:regulator of sigma E protease